MSMLNSTVKEVIKLLKSGTAPGEKTKTLWAELKDQSLQEGTWDPKLLTAIEKKIFTKLSTISDDNLRMMWESTEQGMESFDERESISLDKIKKDLSNELISLVMDNLDSTVDYSEDLNQTKFMDDDGFEDDFGFDDAVGLEDDLF